MYCILIILGISYPGIEILDDHPAEWISEGWTITDEVLIDPTDYFRSLTFPPEDRLQCSTAFVTSDGSTLWRVVLLYNEECVALFEERSRPRRFDVEGNALSTSLGCNYAVVTDRDSTRPWHVMDILWDTTFPFSVDSDFASDLRYATEGVNGGISVYANNEGDVLGISSGIQRTSTARLFQLSGGLLNCIDSISGSVNSGVDHSAGQELFVVVVMSEHGRRLIGFDWDLNELWSSCTGSSYWPSCIELSVAQDGSIVACEWFDGRFMDDGFAVFDGHSGVMLARFPDVGGILSVQVSPAGTYTGITTQHLPDFMTDGDSTIVYSEIVYADSMDVEQMNDYFFSQFEGELAILESRDPGSLVIRSCYSDGYIYPLLLGITDDGSVLFELTERSVEPIDFPHMLKRLVIQDREGNLIWASSPASDPSGHFKLYGSAFTWYSRYPVINFCQTLDGYRVICASEDGQAIRILTLAH